MPNRFTALLSLPTQRSQHAAVKVPKINLYPEDPFYQTFIGKIMRWSVQVGRHIIIFTEVVVISSFASRFVLDRQLSDLNGAILQKQAIAESYGDLEQNILDIQKKTTDVGSILQRQGSLRVVNVLMKITPPDIIFEQVAYLNGKLSLQGKARSSEGLTLFLNTLQSQPYFTQVNLGRVESGTTQDPSLTFSLNSDYRPPGTAASASSGGQSGR
jgi:Tfp pilus assembly protein PilN